MITNSSSRRAPLFPGNAIHQRGGAGELNLDSSAFSCSRSTTQVSATFLVLDLPTEGKNLFETTGSSAVNHPMQLSHIEKLRSDIS